MYIEALTVHTETALSFQVFLSFDQLYGSYWSNHDDV